MTEMTHPTDAAKEPNVVDRAARSADSALEATRRLAGSAIDGVADKVHGLRDLASPVLDRIASPIDAVTAYTRNTPSKALLAAAALGAAMMGLVVLVRRSGRPRDVR